MTITQAQSVQPASVCNIAVGSYITDGTAAAITLTVGFTARFIMVFNETGNDWEVFVEGMADAEAMKWIGTAAGTMITSNGITVSGNTFIIGLDTDINVTSEQISWVAFG